MKTPRTLLFVLPMLALGCGNGSSSPDAAPAVEVLVPAPAGAPTASANGADTNLSCLGNNAPDPAVGGALELTGYVRTLADPTAQAEALAAQVEAFSATGASLGSAFADPEKDGRIVVSVPVTESGFSGYVVVSQEGFLDYRFQSNRPVTGAIRDGWAWLMTQAEVDSWATELSLTLDPAKGILAGAVHDCNGFGLANVMIQVSGSTDDVYYLEGPTQAACPTHQDCATPFAVNDGATFTDETGRFALANLAPGVVSVKAFGRLTDGGELTLLASIEATVAADLFSFVALEPRIGNQ